MKIVFIGTVEFSREALRRLISLKADIEGVVTRKHSPVNTDFSDLSEICESGEIPVHYTDDINCEASVAWIRAKRPDVLFCFGWSQLLNEPLLDIAPRGVIGYHPSLLPKNRGRHPLVWSLALGLEKTGSSFFFMDGEADSGDILSQEEIPITYSDTSRTLYDRVTRCALGQMEQFLPSLESGGCQRIPQDATGATYWRKRTHADGLIDWRMPARGVYNLVRALTRPYAGAHAHYRQEECKVWAVSEMNGHLPSSVEPGRVVAVDTALGSFTVKCGAGAVTILEHEFSAIPKVGDYL